MFKSNSGYIGKWSGINFSFIVLYMDLMCSTSYQFWDEYHGPPDTTYQEGHNITFVKSLINRHNSHRIMREHQTNLNQRSFYIINGLQS